MKHALAGAFLYLFLAPFVGGLLAGVDRIITARMQSRKGPPVFQPFFDVLKLFQKRSIVVNQFQVFYIACFLLFMIFAGSLFFAGGDLLLTVFIFTVAAVFLVLAAYSSNSPYSTIGAERELLQMMAYEPMLLITVVGMYLIGGSFKVRDIAMNAKPIIQYLPAIFLGFLFILTIKLRKSPFDLSTSHHAHQEIVKGITTEFSGPTLAMIEIAHWYENILLLGFIYLFFAFNPVLAIVAVVGSYFLEILIDNSYARLTWQFTVKSSWLVAGIVGIFNLIALKIWM